MLHLHHKKLINIAIIFLASWFLGTFFIHRFEAGYPIGASYFNAFYFTVITTATIWFGDLVPMTIAGKIITMWYAIFYVPLFLYVMTLIYQNNIEKLRAKDKEHDIYISKIRNNIHEVEVNVEAIIENTNIIDKKKLRKWIPKTKSST